MCNNISSTIFVRPFSNIKLANESPVIPSWALKNLGTHIGSNSLKLNKLTYIFCYITKVSFIWLEESFAVQGFEPKREKIVEVRELFQDVLRHGERVHELRGANSSRPGATACVLWIHDLQTRQCFWFVSESVSGSDVRCTDLLQCYDY
jgi:hypothetical protein